MHARCLVVLFFCHFIAMLLFLNTINGDIQQVLNSTFQYDYIVVVAVNVANL